MNAETARLVGVGVGLALLGVIVLRPKSGAVRITGAEATTSYRGDPAACACRRRVPVGRSPDGSIRYVWQDEHDWTLCVEDFSESDVARCFSTTSGAVADGSGSMPAFAPHTIAAKTTDAIESVAGKAWSVLASLFGGKSSSGALAGAVDASGPTTTDDVEGF